MELGINNHMWYGFEDLVPYGTLTGLSGFEYLLEEFMSLGAASVQHRQPRTTM